MIMTKEEYKKWMWDNDPGYFEMMKKDDDFYGELGMENPGRGILGEEEAILYDEFLKIIVIDDDE